MDILVILLMVVGWAISLGVLYLVIRFGVLHALRDHDAKRTTAEVVSTAPPSAHWLAKD